jgi:DNA-binding response OmpR family regulator
MEILIADDDDVACELLAGVVAEFGFQPHCVHDGAAAMLAMQEKPYRMIICDWEMPVMDGPEFCKWVRNGPMSNSTYIIMLTARTDGESSADGIESGADTYLTKPCNPEEVMDHLRLGMKLLAM